MCTPGTPQSPHTHIWNTHTYMYIYIYIYIHMYIKAKSEPQVGVVGMYNYPELNYGHSSKMNAHILFHICMSHTEHSEGILLVT